MNYMEIYTALKPAADWPDTDRTRCTDLAERNARRSLRGPFQRDRDRSYTQPIQMRVEELISGVRATLAAQDLRRGPRRAGSP